MASRYVVPMAAGASLLLGCSGTFTPKACSEDSDCGSANVCVAQAGSNVCVPASSAPVRIGMSAPISGPNQALGVDMKLGVSLAFDAQNALGGIRGRNLLLDFRDDAYQPDLAEKNARDLTGAQPGSGSPQCPCTATPAVAGQTPVSTTALERSDDGVLALLGDVGTPTMLRAAPVALETGTLFFGAFTGASPLLRDDSAGSCHRYVFNVRASYADEARATLEYFFGVGVPDAAHIVSFDQADSYGQSGYNGLVAAYQALRGDFSPPPADPNTPIERARYDRENPDSVSTAITSVTSYLSSLLAKDNQPHTVGVLLTATYGPSAEFITGIRKWQFASDAEQTSLQKATRLTISFSNVSFVGPNALAERLKEAGTINTPAGALPYTDHVFVSQVVPNYQSDQSDIVVAYQKRIGDAGASPSFTSLEGYIAARIFIAGLLAQGGMMTPDALIKTFETMPTESLGLGASAGFSTTDHDYSKSVWGTAIDANGQFENVYYWTEGKPLQLFE